MTNPDKQVALITGASSGIGRAIAKALAKEGAKVVLASRNKEELEQLKAEIEKEGGNALVIPTDVTKPKEAEALVAKTLEQWQRLDIVVNSAGLMPLSYLKNRHLDEWLQMIDVNVKGTLITTYAALPPFKKQKRGHFINLASIDGRELYAGGAVYGASKAAVIAFSRTLRMELSPEFNIRITCLEPGTVDTPLREGITDQEFLDDQDWDEDEAKLQPDDIARAVLYAVQQPQSVNVNEIVIKPTGKA
ncbi:SDR family oxidoreductase [Cesiribacter andamanensis]|uniref:Putative oxidoreductase n=1 Tax=Cesiribacter andamanensis AMV16 TaxID=1279009 RepID=M7NVZ9_9BACT|nr:SDR family oxidoreductase [Cesiribacter andamanensis]EMR02644.1 putative oxidoreductase [Cesiribacter andamanensis AMV16]